VKSGFADRPVVPRPREPGLSRPEGPADFCTPGAIYFLGLARDRPDVLLKAAAYLGGEVAAIRAAIWTA
jgi:hypothetical protein